MKGMETAEAKAALCMWISVKGGPNNGQMLTGNSSPIFCPKSRIQIPFPKGTTASMVVSNYICDSHFIKPNLVKSFDEITRTSSDDQAGLKYNGKLKAPDVVIDKIDASDRGGWDLDSWSYSNKMDGIRFNPSDPLTSIEITGDINGKTHTMNYTSNEENAHWSWYTNAGMSTQMGLDTQMDMGPQDSDSGTTGLTFAWTAKGSWKDSSDASHPNMLGLTWTVDTYWGVSATAQPRSFIDWFCNGHPNSVPENFQNLKVPAPNVDLRMDSLDYFLATNLLYPGAHIFQADSPAAETTAKGLAVPKDLILTGQLETK